tara:strand:+ start:1487 stop:1843 length:357 start_codon:yes stop_codon:yes gene_type:complete
MAHNYKELQFWKRSKKLCVSIYQSTSNFPQEEKFGITNQIRRSAVSIPSNIAEGSSRSSIKYFRRFIEISMGSAYKLETQLSIANEIRYLSDNSSKALLSELLSVIQMMSKFKSLLKL